MRVCVLAVVLGILALTKVSNGQFRGQNDIFSGGCCGQLRGRVWIIHYGDDYGTLWRYTSNFRSSDGWGKAVIESACQAAGINCRFVFGEGSECLISNNPTYKAHTWLGMGLAQERYDACYTYYPTAERKEIALFSDGFVKDDPNKLWYIGNRPSSARRFGNLRIGFGPGPQDEICMKRLLDRAGVRLFDFDRQVIFESSQGDLLRNLGSRYDVAFTGMRDAALTRSVNVRTMRALDLNNDGRADEIICSDAPAGLMTRPDKRFLVDAFNVGLRIIKNNGAFRTICQDRQYDVSATETAHHITWCTQDF